MPFVLSCCCPSCFAHDSYPAAVLFGLTEPRSRTLHAMSRPIRSRVGASRALSCPSAMSRAYMHAMSAVLTWLESHIAHSGTSQPLQPSPRLACLCAFLPLLSGRCRPGFNHGGRKHTDTRSLGSSDLTFPLPARRLRPQPGRWSPCSLASLWPREPSCQRLSLWALWTIHVYACHA